MRTAIATALLVFLAGLSWGQVIDEAAIRKDLTGKIFYLRDFSQRDDIRLTSDGNALTPGRSGPWTVSLVEIKGIKVQSPDLVLSGNRLALLRDPARDELVPFRTRRKIKIRIERFAESHGWRDYFVANAEQLSDLVPAYYRGFLQGKFNHVAAPDDTPKGQLIGIVDQMEVYRGGGDVAPPKTIFAPDPEYNELAREHSIRGVTVFRLIVDQKGRPTHIEVSKPLGMGLDEQALAVLEKWRFQPASKNGRAVAVQLKVEFTFSLYP